MTLLEATIAFVLLSVVGIVCLDQSRGASRLQSSSVEWSRAVARGDAAMAEALSLAPLPGSNDNSAAVGAGVRVTRRPWRGRVDEVVVDVPLADGRVYSLHRLQARANDVTPGRAP